MTAADRNANDSSKKHTPATPGHAAGVTPQGRDSGQQADGQPPADGRIPVVTSREQSKSEPAAEKEVGGRGGLDPVRYGDWEKNGRCIDF